VLDVETQLEIEGKCRKEKMLLLAAHLRVTHDKFEIWSFIKREGSN
jgi:hypothetical protein